MTSELITIHAVVEVGLYESCMRGREGYRSGIRPNHWMPGKDSCFMGQLDFTDRQLLAPGEICIANARFIIGPEQQDYFYVGNAWHIGEANKIVGYVKIINME